MANPLEAGIIGPSQADIAAADNTPRGPIRKSRIFAGIAAVLGIPTSLALISACVPQPPAEVRTVATPDPVKPTAEPVYTPVAIGVSLPAECQTDPNAVKGWEIATSQRPLTAADNPYIDALNTCVLQANKSAEATATAAVSKPDVTPTTAPTAEPTKAATATPEAKKDEPCNIVPQKYCSQAEVINTKNKQGKPEIYIGFPNIPDNEPLFAGQAGQVLKALEDGGAVAIIADPNLSNTTTPAFEVSGGIRLENMLSLNVKKGDIIAYTQNTGIKKFGKYDVVFTIRRLDSTTGQVVPAEDILREWFPNAFAKPAETLAYQGSSNSTPTVLSPLFATSK